MAASKGNNYQALVGELIKDLEAVTDQYQELLKEIHNSELDFASVKTELRILVDNFKELSATVRDGDEQIRLALLEKSIEEIVVRLEKIEERGEESEEVKAAKENGKWQLKAGLITGVLALIGSALALLTDFFK